jgi:hypothetical protein
MRTINPFADDANMDLEDRALVERARAGDRDALEGLVQRHQGWITTSPFACSTIRKTPRTRRRKSSSRH